MDWKVKGINENEEKGTEEANLSQLDQALVYYSCPI